MNRSCKQVVWIAALASSMAIGNSAGLADSLVTTDGDVILGTVSKTSRGFTVQTSDGPVDITADKVKRILYDHPAATPPQPTVAPAATPGTGASTAAKKTVDVREITTLTQQGEAALAAGEFADARDAFTDLLSLDKTSALAGRGLGYAYLKLNKPAKALKPLELAGLNPPLDRSLTMALAASLVAAHNPMRAAKYVKTYLEAHPTPPAPLDEPVINALGISLSQADSAATKSTLFIDGVKLYNKLNADLEARQTGRKRWGIEWQEADAVAAKQKTRQEAQVKVDEAWSKLQTANTQLAAAKSELASVSNTSARRAVRDQQIQAAENKINTATTAVDKMQSAYDIATKALAEVPGPVFPDVIALEDVDLSMSPGGALASATPTSPGVNPQPRPDPVVTPVVPSPTPDAVNPKPESKPADPAPVQPSPTPGPKPAVTPAPAAPSHLTRYAVGFAIAPDTLVTAASVVEGATGIFITTSDGKTVDAEVIRTLHGEGLALLKAKGARLQCLPLAKTPASGSLACYGFPDVELFNPVARQMVANATDQSGMWTVSFAMAPRLPGGPLIHAGAVVGVELGDRDSDLGLIPAATLKSLTSLIEDAGHPDPPAADLKQAVVMVTAQR